MKKMKVIYTRYYLVKDKSKGVQVVVGKNTTTAGYLGRRAHLSTV